MSLREFTSPVVETPTRGLIAIITLIRGWLTALISLAWLQVPRQQCDPVTRQECEQVPREECKQVHILLYTVEHVDDDI
jgi:hypothetical protein